MDNFRQILLLWKDRQGGRINGDAKYKTTVFMELFQEYKDNGFSIEYFTPGVMGTINTATINPGHHSRVKLKKWARINIELLETALYKVYPKGGDVAPSELQENVVFTKEDEPVDIEAQIAEHTPILNTPMPGDQAFFPKDPNKKKIEHFADSPKPLTALTDIESVNEMDAEMAELLGIKL